MPHVEADSGYLRVRCNPQEMRGRAFVKGKRSLGFNRLPQTVERGTVQRAYYSTVRKFVSRLIVHTSKSLVERQWQIVYRHTATYRVGRLHRNTLRKSQRWHDVPRHDQD